MALATLCVVNVKEDQVAANDRHGEEDGEGHDMKGQICYPAVSSSTTTVTPKRPPRGTRETYDLTEMDS